MLSHKYKGVTIANLSLCILEVRVNASYEQDHIMATINVNETYSVFVCSHTQITEHLEVTVPVSAYYYSINVLKNPLQQLQCIRVDHTEINTV